MGLKKGNVVNKSWLSLGSTFMMFSTNITYAPLQKAPETVVTFKEIAAVYDHNLPEYFNALTPQERIMIYYLFRASLPGNRIAADQSHRDAVKIEELFEYIIIYQNELKKQKLPFDSEQFIKEATIYLTYIWANHSQYFMREQADEKRTPSRLGLVTLTKENLIKALMVLRYPHAESLVHQIERALFDRSYESTMCVQNNITQSAVNFYAPDFTDIDFEVIGPHGQSTLNAYFYIDKQDGKRLPLYQKYSSKGKYSSELNVALFWLERAYQHAQEYPRQFDAHFIKSFEYLIEYIKNGDEEFFKKHSIEWLQSNSKIDYVYGFIETYDDPKGYRAIFQSDVTIKSVDIDKLAALLPDVEDRLPFPAAFKRATLQGSKRVMPNASINVKAFAAGSLGPINLTLAYCLPNYDEIRSAHGSKQIIYHAEKSIGELTNAQLYHQLFNRADYYAWFEQYDPQYALMREIFMLEVILHETVGHGSGQLAYHTFVQGDQLTIEGLTYKVGDTIAVTSGNLPPLLQGYEQTIEELRAEIIALLAAITSYDDLAKLGMLKEWPKKVGKEKIIELFILSMARAGLLRLRIQADNAQEVVGAHAQANMTIMNYMIEHGAIRLEQEKIETSKGSLNVLDIRILDVDHATQVVADLANRVQRIKSTGDGVGARLLIDTYGKPINQDHMRIIKENMKAIVGDVKVTAMIYPHYEPFSDNHGKIIDIKAVWPKSFQEQYIAFKDMALSTK